MIEANKVGLTYPDGTPALREIDLNVLPGELVYIVGPSGSGKTSLLKLLMAVEFPGEGHLSVLGYTIARDRQTELQKMRMKLGPVFQEFRLIKGRTVLENVILGMRFLNMHYGQMKENAVQSIDRVGLSHKLHNPVEHLSWGECQRVAIARAVARKPALILADEPTGNLDKDNAMNILDLLISFKDNKTAVMITTHATHLINLKNEGRIIRMAGGRII